MPPAGEAIIQKIPPAPPSFQHTRPYNNINTAAERERIINLIYRDDEIDVKLNTNLVVSPPLSLSFPSFSLFFIYFYTRYLYTFLRREIRNKLSPPRIYIYIPIWKDED